MSKGKVQQQQVIKTIQLSTKVLVQSKYGFYISQCGRGKTLERRESLCLKLYSLSMNEYTLETLMIQSRKCPSFKSLQKSKWCKNSWNLIDDAHRFMSPISLLYFVHFLDFELQPRYNENFPLESNNIKCKTVPSTVHGRRIKINTWGTQQI